MPLIDVRSIYIYRSLKGTVAKQREGVLQSCELNILVQETFTRIWPVHTKKYNYISIHTIVLFIVLSLDEIVMKASSFLCAFNVISVV